MMRWIILIIAVMLVGCGSKSDCPPSIPCRPGIEIKQIAFWYKDNILYWAFNGKYEPKNYIVFQLDKHFPNPTINYDPIKRIEVMPNRVIVFTKNKYWILHCEGTIDDWFVEDYKEIE